MKAALSALASIVIFALLLSVVAIKNYNLGYNAGKHAERNANVFYERTYLVRYFGDSPYRPYIWTGKHWIPVD